MDFSDLLKRLQRLDGTENPDVQVRFVRGLGGTPTETQIDYVVYVPEEARRPTTGTEEASATSSPVTTSVT